MEAKICIEKKKHQVLLGDGKQKPTRNFESNVWRATFVSALSMLYLDVFFKNAIDVKELKVEISRCVLTYIYRF